MKNWLTSQLVGKFSRCLFIFRVIIITTTTTTADITTTTTNSVSSNRLYSILSSLTLRKLFHMTCIVYLYFRLKNNPLAVAAAVCPNVCDCKWTDGKETVSCRNANFTDVPRNLDSTVLILDLDGNALIHLGADAFNIAGLWNLQRIYLIRCKIKTVDENAFRALRNLVYLDLSYNILIHVPSSSFGTLTELRELKLTGNPILKISANAFAKTRQLKRLDISECRIGYVETTAFSGLEHTLEKLKLDRNRITNVEPVAFTLLHSLHAIELQNNPWNCSCLLRPLRHWLLQRTVPLGPSPICKYPTRNANKTWSELGKDEFACLPRLYAVHATVTAFEGENVTLSCKIDGTSPMPNVRWILRSRILLNGNYEYPVTDKKPYVKHYVTSEYANLTILSLQLQDSGLYVCVAENVAGKVTAEISLTVNRHLAEPVLPEKYVTMGILLSVIAIVLLCALVLVVRVMDSKPADETGSGRSSFKLPPKPTAPAQEADGLIANNTTIASTTAAIGNSAAVKSSSASASAKKISVQEQTDGGISKTDNKLATDKRKPKEDPALMTCSPNGPITATVVKKPSTLKISKDSPRNSMFDSHIGEMALQHHILHKKELPSGNLYTTAMSFMQEDNLANNYYVDNAKSDNDQYVKATADDKNRKELRDNRSYSDESKYGQSSKGSTTSKRYYGNAGDGQSQSPLLASDANNYRDEDDDGPNLPSSTQRRYSTFDRGSNIRKSESTYHRSSSLRRPAADEKYYRQPQYYSSSFDSRFEPPPPTARRRYGNNVNECSSSSGNNSDSKGYDGISTTKETPLLNNIHKKPPYHHDRSRYADYSSTSTSAAAQQQQAIDAASTSSLIISPTKASTTYDYHSAQLERFLHEYRQIHSELTKMKESCEKIDHQRKSVDKIHSSRSSLERSVSFVPNLKDTSIRTASDDNVIPRSILKKTQLDCDGGGGGHPSLDVTSADNAANISSNSNSGRNLTADNNPNYYYYYNNYDHNQSNYYGVGSPSQYRSNTLPLSRRRYRRYSTSSMDDYVE